jgi:CBS domain containing-hemolysin-like protein
MTLEVWIELGLIVFATLLLALVSAARTSLSLVSRACIKDSEEGAEAVRALLDDPDRCDSTLVLLQSGALVAAASPGTALALRYVPYWGQVAAIMSFVVVVLIVAWTLPRAWALGHPQRVALALGRPVRGLITILGPLMALLQSLSGFLTRALGGREWEQPLSSEEEIRRLVDEREEEGPLEEEEKEMIAGIFELGETFVREVMVPRIDIVALEVDTPLPEALDLIMKAGHSRIPVYEGDIDHIVGLLYAKDLLPLLSDGHLDISLREVVRPAYFIPETNKIDELLAELRDKRVHMDIVVDEYGGTSGLVTIEDILEEIVGEIQDEYDREEPPYRVINENEVIFNARMDLDDVNELMGLELPTEGGDTLGGLIYSRLGRVPSAGEEVALDGVKIAVLSVVGRRIKEVKVIKEQPE